MLEAGAVKCPATRIPFEQSCASQHGFPQAEWACFPTCYPAAPRAAPPTAHHEVGVRGAEYLGEALGTNRTLRTLNLHNTGVMVVGALAQAVTCNTALTSPRSSADGRQHRESHVLGRACSLRTHSASLERVSEIRFVRTRQGLNRRNGCLYLRWPQV